LRTLLGDDRAVVKLLDPGIPACATNTLDDLNVLDIAAVGHLY
jgi:hypothetical protein